MTPVVERLQSIPDNSDAHPELSNLPEDPSSAVFRLYSRFVEVVLPAAGKGHCESCGISIGITGGYRVAGLNGVYHSLFCLEQGIFYKADPRRKGSQAAHIGKGELLRSFIADLAEKEASKADGQVCCYCGGTLITCRAGATYCSASCRQMAYANSKNRKSGGKNPHKRGSYSSIVSPPSMLSQPGQ